MTDLIKFTKMHGAGNDYIYVNTFQNAVADPEKAAILWSDRHKGIGSDGLVLICSPQSSEADFKMRIFNADGSEAMMCGNASRCIGKYLYERHLTEKTEIRLETLSGVKTLMLHLSAEGTTVESVTVDMLEPRTQVAEQFVKKGNHVLIADNRFFHGTFVSMGNPHFVTFVDDVEHFDVGRYGRILETDECFPERCNIEFAEVLTNGNIRVRVWERGSGITMACGTGACATAVAARLTGRSGRENRIIMDGGELDIEWRESDNHVYMTGQATFVFDGEIAAL